MKKIVLCGLLLALALPIMAETPTVTGTRAVAKPTIIDTQVWLDANRILMFINNVGNFAYDAGQTFGRNDGFYFPFSSVNDILSGKNDKHAIFDGGIWLGAKDHATGDVLVALAEYAQEFGPGPMDSTTHEAMTDSPNFKVFKLRRDSIWANGNQAYRDYVAYAIPQGAPDTIRIDTIFFFDSLAMKFDTTKIVKVDTVPGFPGDQYTWCVFNDADPANHVSTSGKTAPMGIQVKQEGFAFSGGGPMSNVEFIRYRIKNMGTKQLDSMYVSIWSDPDLGGSTDDLVGCDTLRQISTDPKTGKPVNVTSMGFCYNGTNNDAIYGSTPPAIGYDFFQGPIDSTGNPADTAIAYGRQWPGNRNLPMSSFNKYINGTDPTGAQETYNYMSGRQKDGSVYTYLGKPTKYFVSGDPVTGTGDLDVSPADRRLELTTGPFTFKPGDSAEIVCAVIAGQGADRLQSITVLRGIDVFAQNVYNGVPIGKLKIKNFAPPQAPAAPDVKVTQEANRVTLSWSDLSEVKHGDFPFEGYAVLQSHEVNGRTVWDTLAVFDTINGIKAAIDSVFVPPLEKLTDTVIITGGDFGIQRTYSVTTDKLTGDPLHNYSQYNFRVLAYSVNEAFTPGSKVLVSNTDVTVTPQPRIPGTKGPVYSDSLPTVHVGNSDATVQPFVIRPTELTHDQYQVTFTMKTETTVVFTPAAFDTSFSKDSTGAFDTTLVRYICGVTTPDSLGHFDTLYCTKYVRVIEAIDTTDASYDTTIADVPQWSLKDLTKDTVLVKDNPNVSGDQNYPLIDGVLWRVVGATPGLKTVSPPDNKTCDPTDRSLGWCIPNGTRRFTWANADGLGFEDFNGALGWSAPATYFGGAPEPVPAVDIRNVLLKLATVDSAGTFDPSDPNVSYGYRYLRNATQPPARPEFAPFIINTSASYEFQDFVKTVPLSAWNTETTPPTRLALGWLENNVDSGLVDGKYWPPFTDAANNTSSSGPREWLFIFNAPYSETPNPAYETNASGDASIPIMYWASWARRAEVGWNTGDEFQMYANHPITTGDTFTVTSEVTKVVASEAALKNIRTVPNPYYLFSSYDSDVNHRQLRFTNLPQVCTISIYNLAGDRVTTIDKNSSDTWTFWNLTNSSGVPVASGIYIWVVDAPGYGQKIGKTAVFLEQEQLKTY